MVEHYRIMLVTDMPDGNEEIILPIKRLPIQIMNGDITLLISRVILNIMKDR